MYLKETHPTKDPTVCSANGIGRAKAAGMVDV
jgi:hypothetical protein